MTTRTSEVGNQDSGEPATASFADSLPGGWLGYVEVTTAQTGMTGTNDLTGLTLTVSLNASRRIRVTAFGSSFVTSVGGTAERAELQIKEGGTVLNFSRLYQPATLDNTGAVVVSWVGTPSAGSHTYKLTHNRSAGAGGTTWDLNVSATQPAWLLVEDLGPSS